MFIAKRPLSTATAVLAIAALGLTGCGSNPASSALKAKTATKATAQVATPVTDTAVTPVSPEEAAPTGTGTVMLMLSSLQASGVAGVAVQLTGPGLAEPIGKTLTADELTTSNTLAFENMPVGTLKAELAAFDADENILGQVAQDVEIKLNGEIKVAMKLSAPDVAAGSPLKVNFTAVSPDEFDAPPMTVASPTPAPSTEPSTAPVTPGTPVDGSKALKVEVTSKTVVRSWIFWKKLEVTLLVKNTNTTETLDGEVKLEFHKMKGIFSKTDAIVETQTAPIANLAPGKSIELTLTSTVSAEDAEATVHTVVASSSANTFDY